MTRLRVLGALAVALVAAAGCSDPGYEPPYATATGVSGETACAAPYAAVTPVLVAPGAEVTVTLENMTDECFDSGDATRAETPIAETVTVTLVSVDGGTPLATGEVRLGDDAHGETVVSVPADAAPGDYDVVLSPALVGLEAASLTVTSD